MKKALTYITFLDLLFILLLSVSGYFEGIAGNVLYYLAFAIPTCLAFIIKRYRDVGFSAPKLKISGENLGLTLPIIFPTLALIFVISFVTSFLLSLFGAENNARLSGDIITLIFTHAFLTSICEEALFGYVPIALLSPYSKRCAVIFSSVFFALAHCSLYQIPYAFAAGLIFCAIDIVCESVIPSLLIHFINNLISIIWIKWSDDMRFVWVYVTVIGASALISCIFIFLFRKKYKKKISALLSEKEKIQLSYAPILFIIMTLVIAVTGI